MPPERPRHHQPASTPTNRMRKRAGARQGLPPHSRQAAPRRVTTAADIRRIRRRVVAALYTLLLIECAAAALTSPAVAIREVRVSGAETLPIAEADAVSRAAQIGPGSNWFRLRSAPIAARLAAMPWVARVSVEKRFPDRCYVRVTARQPAAVVQFGGQLAEVDASAIPIRPARPEVTGRLRRVVLPPGVGLVYGALIQDDGARAALRILQDTADDMTVRIAKIEVDQSDNLCLNMHDNTAIRLGPAEDLDVKLSEVRRLCRNTPDLAKSFSAIDLTCPAKPACTPRAPLTPAAAVSSASTADLTQ
jgi:cell division protein FtsQ